MNEPSILTKSTRIDKALQHFAPAWDFAKKQMMEELAGFLGRNIDGGEIRSPIDLRAVGAYIGCWRHLAHNVRQDGKTKADRTGFACQWQDDG